MALSRQFINTYTHTKTTDQYLRRCISKESDCFVPYKIRVWIKEALIIFVMMRSEEWGFVLVVYGSIHAQIKLI